jgi:aspartate 1-decarboxylase
MNKMLYTMLKAKIHNARVTEANLNYEGSITIDESLMEASGILPYEKVQILNTSNGIRAETYVITGKKNSGHIIMNGAIARLAQVGDRVIILSWVLVDDAEVKKLHPCVVLVNDETRIVQLR